MKLEQLGLQIAVPFVHSGAINFRPPSWPPPPDWSPIRDATGVPQCKYEDSVWPLDTWAGKSLKLNFGDGKTRGKTVDKINANLLRQCTAWFLFGPRGCRNANSLKERFDVIKSIFATCTQEGIVATDITRFPKVLDKVAQEMRPSSFGFTITVLHELLDARFDLGFCLFDKDALTRLTALTPDHLQKQTPYIPPRIWTYQVTRLRECLTDYLSHKKEVESCFEFCLDAYARNFGSLKLAVNSKVNSTRAPFQIRLKNLGKGCIYPGQFRHTAERFGILQMIEKWVGPYTNKKGEKQITMFSQYLDLVSKAGLAYALNFSLMRIDEAWNLRTDCWLTEKDEQFGNIHMLQGNTTKTDLDSDARWPISQSAEMAVEVMKHIAGLRMRCCSERDGVGLTPTDKKNPFLISYQYEPWSRGKSKSYSLRPLATGYADLIKSYPQLFDPHVLTITEEDLRVARLITPSLCSNEFKVGGQWKLTWHQLRRSGAVNMLSSDMVDESSLQFLLKHQSRVMTLYYGRNHSRLSMNKETQKLFLKTMYQELGRELQNLQSPQFVSPFGPSRKADIVSFITEKDAVSLDTAARQGKVGARRIRAGFCVKYSSCPFGGHEAIAHCLGDKHSPGCPDLLVDIKREPDIRAYEKVIEEQLNIVHTGSPRYSRLRAEKQAIMKYYEFSRS